MSIKEQITPSSAHRLLDEIEYLIKSANERGATRAMRRFIERFALGTHNHWTMILSAVYEPKVLESGEYDRYARYGDIVLPALSTHYQRELSDYEQAHNSNGRKLSSFLQVSFRHIKDPDGKMAASIGVCFDRSVQELNRQDMLRVLAAMASACLVCYQSSYFYFEELTDEQLNEEARSVLVRSECWATFLG